MLLKLLDDVKVPVDFNLPKEPSTEELLEDAKLFEKAKTLIKEKKAFFLAHYYCSPIIQKLCEETVGKVILIHELLCLLYHV